ncbi:MAG: DUF2461 domain-containing protein [Oscillospiraceae bacterium]
MTFAKRSLEFLFENRLYDSKEWYNEHKDEYKKLITEPFAELLTELAPMFDEIDPKLICDRRRISRVYRDTRFTKDKTLFRDHIWATISRPKQNTEVPSFYFDISQHGFEYGCGYYCADKNSIEALRELVKSGSKEYKAAEKALKGQSVFTMGGDMYKREHFPDQPAEKQNWLNRKNVFFFCESKDFDLLFSDRLADRLKQDFPLLAPVYRLLIKAEESAAAERSNHRFDEW